MKKDFDVELILKDGIKLKTHITLPLQTIVPYNEKTVRRFFSHEVKKRHLTSELDIVKFI